MKKTLLAAALLCCLPAAHAADQNDASALAPVIVTATRTPITADDALTAVSVITRADIERLQPVSLQDLLAGLPGVGIAQSGGLGQLSALYLRGSNSTHTLVLVDGVRIGSVSAGEAALEQLPVEQIERIEIVRGPRSSLYGADAIGGVIQIFTRHGQAGGGLAPSLSLTAGSHGLFGGQAGLAGGDAHAWYNLSLGGKYTSGFPACRMGAAEAMAGCYVDDPRSDAYRNWNGAANAGYRWDNGTELAFTWLRSKSDVEFAGSPYGGNNAINEQRVAGARLGFSPLQAWKLTLNAGQSKDLSDTYYQGSYYGAYYAHTPTGFYASRRNQFSWQNDLALAPNQLLTVGVDYQQQHLASSTGYLATRSEDTGTYAQYQGTFGRHELQLSARHDHDQQFGNHDTGAAAWGYRFEHGLRVYASYGTAFHAPTFNDLYYPPYAPGVPSANPDLKPEKSRSAELGLAQQLAGWNWGVSAYQTRIDDLILLDPARNYVPFNVSKARIRGLEGQLGANLGGWQLQGYLTLLQPKNIEGANDGKRLPRRAERTARIDLDRRYGAFGVGATWYAAGDSYDDAANLHRLGGYSTLALRASWHFTPDWQVEAKLANAFDRRYETAYYYNQPGRSWYLTLRYSPAAR